MYYHDPTITDKGKWTVAMMLASKGIISSKEWEHRADLQNSKGWTVAMMLAGSGVIPPS